MKSIDRNSRRFSMTLESPRALKVPLNLPMSKSLKIKEKKCKCRGKKKLKPLSKKYLALKKLMILSLRRRRNSYKKQILW
jgi:hypothetical protein